MSRERGGSSTSREGQFWVLPLRVLICTYCLSSHMLPTLSSENVVQGTTL